MPSVGRGAGIIARSGGTGINEGIIDATGIAMRAYDNSTIVNDGTIYSGINNTKHRRHGEGMVAINAGSLAINNGIINIRPYKVATVNPDGINTAMLVAGGGEGINNGTINITADASTVDSKGLTRGSVWVTEVPLPIHPRAKSPSVWLKMAAQRIQLSALLRLRLRKGPPVLLMKG